MVMDEYRTPWNDEKHGKLKFSEINPAQCHFVHHKYLRSEDV
jgi:hypothetical protein